MSAPCHNRAELAVTTAFYDLKFKYERIVDTLKRVERCSLGTGWAPHLRLDPFLLQDLTSAAARFNEAARGFLVGTTWQIWSRNQLRILSRLDRQVKDLIDRLGLARWYCRCWNHQFTPSCLFIRGRQIWDYQPPPESSSDEETDPPTSSDEENQPPRRSRSPIR